MIQIDETVDNMGMRLEHYTCLECGQVIYTEVIGDRDSEEKNEAINEHLKKCRGDKNEQ